MSKEGGWLIDGENRLKSSENTKINECGNFCLLLMCQIVIIMGGLLVSDRQKRCFAEHRFKRLNPSCGWDP